MNEKEKFWVTNLSESCELKTPEDFVIYQEAISVLQGINKPEILEVMLQCFRDIDAGEVQYELLEACELFDDEIYVKVFLKEGIFFFNKSPKWFRLAFQSILNSEATLLYFYKYFLEMIEGDKAFYLNFVKYLDGEYKGGEYAVVYQKLQSYLK